MQTKNTVQFKAMGQVVRTVRVMKGETHATACGRAGICLQNRNDAAGTVYVATYRGQSGEARFA